MPLELSPQAQMAKQREDAMRLHKIGVAMSVLQDAEIAKKPGSVIDSLVKRAAEVVLAHLNRED